MRKKDDFVGWISPDGNLEVIGYSDKNKHYKTQRRLYKVTCKICSPDIELYPDRYFLCQKGHLKRGIKPCGCALNPKWKPSQYLILASRAGEKKGFIVHGFIDKYENSYTKISCECLLSNHKWVTKLTNITKGLNGCPECAIIKQRTSENTALKRCTDLCVAYNYTPLGFPEGYKNAYSRFEYVCPRHGKHNVSYNKFINTKQKCPECWRDKQKEIGGFYGWYPERSEEQDFLYILNFDDQYIKVGRSFDIRHRLKQLSVESGIININAIYVYTALHKEIFTLEQRLHVELTNNGFYDFESTWSTETFSMDSLNYLEKLLLCNNITRVYDFERGTCTS